ncbi:hypothetical protein [Primorskyibacter sp. S187A]|uniref:hypothetical protein n=1 Tax=Primorskyibacter sp. S187A TaxID=3415130 RepID=UPI003C7A6192
MRLLTVSSNGKAICAAGMENGAFLDIAKAAQNVTGAGGHALRAGSMQAGHHADAQLPSDAPFLAPSPNLSRTSSA